MVVGVGGKGPIMQFDESQPPPLAEDNFIMWNGYGEDCRDDDEDYGLCCWLGIVGEVNNVKWVRIFSFC